MPSPKSKSKAGTTAASAEQRRKLFVESFLSNGENITKAALDAGFSPKSAASQGSRLLKDAKVQQLLDSRRNQALEKAQLTTDGVLASLRQALFFDPRKLYREDGTLKAVSELDDDTAMALTGLDVFEEFEGRGEGRTPIGLTKKLKWLDKNIARDQAAKILRMYRDPLAQPPGAEVANAVAAGFDSLKAAFQKRLGAA